MSTSEESVNMSDKESEDMSSEVFDLLKKIDERLTVIEKRTDKIDNIDEKLNVLTSKVGSLERDMSDVKQKTNELEMNVQGISNLFDKIQETCNKNEANIKSAHNDIKKMKDTCSELEADRVDFSTEIDELREKMLELQTRSMKYNLIFSGIPEAVQENTEAELRKFMKDELLIPQHLEELIKLGNVHRFGSHDERRGKHRPIIARFVYYKDLKMILDAGPRLKGKNYGINQQFPQEIEERRKKLYPVFKRAKTKGHKVALVRDKLFIDGQRYVGETEDKVTFAEKVKTPTKPSRKRFRRSGSSTSD